MTKFARLALLVVVNDPHDNVLAVVEFARGVVITPFGAIFAHSACAPTMLKCSRRNHNEDLNLNLRRPQSGKSCKIAKQCRNLPSYYKTYYHHHHYERIKH